MPQSDRPIRHCRYEYRQRYSSQRGTHTNNLLSDVDIYCGLTQLRFEIPQHFNYYGDEYRLQ